MICMMALAGTLKFLSSLTAPIPTVTGDRGKHLRLNWLDFKNFKPFKTFPTFTFNSSFQIYTRYRYKKDSSFRL